MYISASPSLSPAYFLKSSVPNPLPFPLDRSNSTYFYVARNGIYHLMRSLGVGKGGVVLAPDYYHGNEIRAMRAAGATIQFYPVRKNLQADLDVLHSLCKAQPRVLYVTHYIGWPQPLKDIQEICRQLEITLVEDCALSFMSDIDGKPLGSFGDYSVFCLYKTIPIPNGGVLVCNSRRAQESGVQLQQCGRLSVAAQTTELLLQWLRSRHELPGRCLFGLKRAAGRTLTASQIRRIPVGDSGFNVASSSLAMSALSHALLPRFAYSPIKEARRRNFLALEGQLRGKVRLLDVELTKGVCPLFFPLLVTDKDRAARLLNGRGIKTIEFWNEGIMHSGRNDAEFLRRHLLEVPIHQDIDTDAVDHIARQILNLRIGLSS
jgi:dTDP-4-amino-4,6-dideoxygalactose transaminase